MNQINLTQWEEVQDELRGQMGKSTYDAHIRNAVAVDYDGHRLTILAHNDSSAKWIEHRLKRQIEHTAKAIYGGNLVIIVKAGDWEPEAVPAATHIDLPPEQPVTRSHPPPQSCHFEPVRNNWVKTPLLYYTHILAGDYKPSTKIVIGAVIAHTLGVIDTKGNSLLWWENVTITGDLVAATKLSKNSVKAGIEEALSAGWIRCRASSERPGIANDYALRYAGESVYVEHDEAAE